VGEEIRPLFLFSINSMDTTSSTTSLQNHLTPGDTTPSIPNPFFKAMNQDTQTDIGLIETGKIGSLLRRKAVSYTHLTLPTNREV